ncbi:hypothetical protein EJ110_NYTH28335 [Nymphaea thermarum]|nr:hypothetical protein EJ110_NYTH28335 [Nymphaea thermarum]
MHTCHTCLLNLAISTSYLWNESNVSFIILIELLAGRGGRGRGKTTSRPVCQFCHRIGHTVDKCWQKHGRPAFANLTASTDSPEQPKAQHTAPSSELCVDDIISQLRNLIGDIPQPASDPTTSTITTAASASSSGMYSAYTCTFVACEADHLVCSMVSLSSSTIFNMATCNSSDHLGQSSGRIQDIFLEDVQCLNFGVAGTVKLHQNDGALIEHGSISHFLCLGCTKMNGRDFRMVRGTNGGARTKQADSLEMYVKMHNKRRLLL